MIHYKVKQPKFSNTACKTLIRIEGEERIYKDKRKFDTLEEAITECRRVNAMDKTIHKIVLYKCQTCFKYHVGRSGKLNKK